MRSVFGSYLKLYQHCVSEQPTEKAISCGRAYPKKPSGTLTYPAPKTSGTNAPMFHHGNFECVSLASIIRGLSFPKANITSSAYSINTRFEVLSEGSRREEEWERGQERARARKQRKGMCCARDGRKGRDAVRRA